MPCLATSGASPWLHLVGRLHPVVVHFPIALLLAAGLAELLRVRAGARGDETSAVARFCLLLGALAATAAAGSGWVNAAVEAHGRSVAQLVERHRWSGVALAVLAWATVAAAALRERGARWVGVAYRAGLAATCGVVVLTGHLGASLVWGPDYLTAPFAERPSGAPAEADPAPAAEPGTSATAEAAPEGEQRVDFRVQVLPLLAEHCFRCHGESRRKAGLRLDDPSELFAGDPEWWVVRPGSRAESALYQRISLPADHEDRMPGDGDPLPPEAIETIGRWIDQGAELGDAASE